MLLWSSSEVCLTIVCASIPVLRPLYVRIAYGSRGDSSGKQSYPLNDYSKSKNSRSGMGTGNPPSNKIYMGPGESVMETTVRMGSENDSAETILRAEEQKYNLSGREDDGTRGKGDIKVTTTVTSQDDRV